MRLMEILGVRVETPSNQPLVLLRESDGGRLVPIWVGAIEASAIAFAHQGTETVRPLTHELMAAIISELDAELAQVNIVRVEDGVFFAELHFSSGVVVDARPSDAIALALRSRVDVWCAESVLDEAGFEPVPEEEDEVAQFREFLDHIEPGDFA
ncbi:MAG: bifunctional nuclease family protein [Porphyromonadaceae bacterium]|nr:bifunctional nuclease family protein [Porphyromonadaceae bacterium]